MDSASTTLDSLTIIPCRLRPRPKALNMEVTRCLGTPTHGPTIQAIPTDGGGELVRRGGGRGCWASVSVSRFYFNPCAFAAPGAGKLGNANRAPLSGPGFVNTDFSVIKRFALPWENMGLDFRAEFFNLFNHAQFDTPSAFGGGTGADIASPSQFGRVPNTVNNPRVIQFG